MSSELASTTTDSVNGGDLRTEEMLLNMGPQHPATHGVLRVLVRTDGEMVIDCEPHVGYLHRCFEKHCESVSWLQSVLYTDRLDYLTAMGNNWGYCMAVERLFGGEIEIPTIDGGRARVTVPEGAQTGRKLRLKGKGMPSLRGSGQGGDLFVEMIVETPRNLSARQKELLREFCELSCADCNPQSEGFLGRVKKFWDGMTGEDGHRPN